MLVYIKHIFLQIIRTFKLIHFMWKYDFIDIYKNIFIMSEIVIIFFEKEKLIITKEFHDKTVREIYEYTNSLELAFKQQMFSLLKTDGGYPGLRIYFLDTIEIPMHTVWNAQTMLTKDQREWLGIKEKVVHLKAVK